MDPQVADREERRAPNLSMLTNQPADASETGKNITLPPILQSKRATVDGWDTDSIMKDAQDQNLQKSPDLRHRAENMIELRFQNTLREKTEQRRGISMLNISNLDASHNIPNGNTSRMKNEQLDNADSCYSFDSDNQ